MDMFEKVREAVRDMELRCLEEVQREKHERDKDRASRDKEVMKVLEILSQREMQVIGAELEIMDKNWEQSSKDP